MQVSRDGGRSWSIAGPLPDGLIDLAASALSSDRLYAATRFGLLYSTDSGVSWEPGHLRRSPVTMVQTGHSGEIYAYMLGVGLLRAKEPSLGWEVAGPPFEKRYILHFAVHPGNPRRLFAVMNDKAILTSDDGGGSWAAMGCAGRS